MANDFEEDELGGVEDEDLLLAAMDVERAFAPHPKVDSKDPIPNTSLDPYRLEFGKHRGKTLDEVPPTYINWIIGEKIYDKGIHPDLKASLLARGMIMDHDGPSTSLANASKKDPIKPNNSSKSDNPSDPSVPTYRLNFGKYAGKTLKEVPISYICFLTRSRAQESRSDLRGALTELAYSTDASSETPNQAVGTRDHHDRVFFDQTTGQKLWITIRDALVFFGVNKSHLQPAGITPLKKGQWDLFDIYDYVQRHASVRSADLGLNQFLQKNSDREEDIWAEMGLGSYVGCGDWAEMEPDQATLDAMGPDELVLRMRCILRRYTGTYEFQVGTQQTSSWGKTVWKKKGVNNLP